MMEYVECGDTDGRLVFYFHGAPGAPEECRLFDAYAKRNGLRIICLDRLSISKNINGKKINGQNYYKCLANEIEYISGGQLVDIIGFSIGCAVALNVASILKSKVATLHLISAAAPIESGNFIEHMAGKTIFKMARKYPTGFMVLSYWQALLSFFCPNVLYKMLFASAKGKDKSLKEQDAFKAFILSIIKKCFGQNINGYIRDVILYVTPWESALAQCQATCYIWHGKNDNWSPVDMALYLSKTLPRCASVELFSNLSHYSCLYEAAPSITTLLSVHKADKAQKTNTK